MTLRGLCVLTLLLAAPLLPAQEKPPSKPLRVLLLAEGPNRSFQFVRDLFLREQVQGRAEVSVVLQTSEPDSEQAAPARLLSSFPGRNPSLPGPKSDLRHAPDSLAAWDLVIACDPDWRQLTRGQQEALRDWVRAGGGLIVVAGPINTYLLARQNHNIQQVADLLPVTPADSRLLAVGGGALDQARPWPLNFTAAAARVGFLRLQEGDSLAGWQEFFWGSQPPEKKDPVALRGLHHFEPVAGVKREATVLATLGGPPSTRIKDGLVELPILVVQSHDKGRCVWVGSNDFWRLRTYRVAAHERFWLGLAAFARGQVREEELAQSQLRLPGEATVGEPIEIEARLLDSKKRPVPISPRPILRLEAGPGKPAVEVVMEPVQAGRVLPGWFRARVTPQVAGELTLRIHSEASDAALSDKLFVKTVVQKTVRETAVQRQASINRERNELLYLLVRQAQLGRNSSDAEVQAHGRLCAKLLQQWREDNSEQLGEQLLQRLGSVKEGQLADLQEALNLSRKLDNHLGKLQDMLGKRSKVTPEKQLQALERITRADEALLAGLAGTLDRLRLAGEQLTQGAPLVRQLRWEAAVATIENAGPALEKASATARQLLGTVPEPHGGLALLARETRLLKPLQTVRAEDGRAALAALKQLHPNAADLSKGQAAIEQLVQRLEALRKVAEQQWNQGRLPLMLLEISRTQDEQTQALATVHGHLQQELLRQLVQP